MKIAVAGGTGLTGRLVVHAAEAAGHDVTVISRARNVDLVSGSGLDAALRGIDVVIDVSNTAGFSAKQSIGFFAAATRNLLAAEVATGVGHHVALSIVGIDRVSSGYNAGKLRQEELIAAGSVPWTVVRATQFHEFPAQLLAAMKGPVVFVPRMRSATIAAREVAEHLVEVAAGPALGRGAEMSGPEVHEMPDLARRLLRARRQRRLVVPVRVPGRAGALMARGGLLPTGSSLVGKQTFDTWLLEQAGRP
jgi:uncharacterized protein YbjT (DUF2867 family)